MQRTLLGSLLVTASSLAIGQTYSWSNPAGGNWFDVVNWTGNQKPTNTTTAASVFINSAPHLVPGMTASTEITMPYSVGTLQSGNRLALIGSSTTLSIYGTGSTINNQLYGQNVAMITGPGDLTVTGGISAIGIHLNLGGGLIVHGNTEFYNAFQVGKATFTGLTNVLGSFVGLENPATPLIAHPVINSGTMRFNDGTSFSNGNLTNQAGAMIEKTTGTGSATLCSFNGLIPQFTNYGFVRCTSGTLNLSGYGDQRGQWITEGTARIGIQGEQTMRGGFFGGDAVATLSNGGTLTTSSNSGTMVLGGLELSNGTVKANTPIRLESLTMNGGRFQGPEAIEVDGPATVTSGIFESGTTKFQGPTQWTAGASKIVTSVIENLNTLTRIGGGEIGSGNGEIRNYGTFRTTGGGQMMGIDITNHGTWIVDNAALGGMFITPNGADGSFNNLGSVDVVGGTFEFAVSGSSTGSWSNTSPHLTRFGQVSHTFGTSSTFPTARFSAAGAFLDFQGTATLPYLQLSGSTGTEIRSQSQLIVQDVEGPAGGQTTFSGEGEIRIEDQFATGGAVYFNGPGLNTFAGGVNTNGLGNWIVNRSVTLDGPSTLTVNASGAAFGELINIGSLSLFGSNASIQSLPFANMGTMAAGGYTIHGSLAAPFVQAGTLSVPSFFTLRGYSGHHGTTTTSGGGRLILDSGLHEFQPGNDYSGADIVLKRALTEPSETSVLGPTSFRYVELQNPATINASSDLSIGTVIGTGLNVSGTGTVRSTTNAELLFPNVLAGGRFMVDSGNLTLHQPSIEGTFEISGLGTHVLSGITGGNGTLINRSSSTLSATGNVTVMSSVTNEGTLNISATNIFSSLGWFKLLNSGTLNLSNGTLNVMQSPNLVGTVFTGGTWNIGPASVVQVASDVSNWQANVKFIGPHARIYMPGGINAFIFLAENNGQISFTQGNSQSISSSNLVSRGLIETDATSSFSVAGALNMLMGELKNRGTMTYNGGMSIASGTVNFGGTITTPQLNQNGGTLSAAHDGAGLGTLNGDLNLGFGSTLTVDVNPSMPSSSDRIQVNGNATLGGGIQLRIPNGSTLPPGTDLTVISSSNPIQGGFLSVPAGFALSTSSNSATLTSLATIGTLTVVSGSILFGDYLNDPFGLTATISFVQNGVPMGSIPTIIDESGNYYVHTHLRGTFDVYADSTPWLRRKNPTPIVITDSGVTNLNFSLQNGDTNSSGEVDAADIDDVIAAFGSTDPGIPQDLNGSAEVDAADIDIVIANFGAVDD
ncbi:MAG: hypothetical protein JNK63_00110 [Chthonomonas sp.]|nr:hypothetical protein [Chthonomonas sp.]